MSMLRKLGCAVVSTSSMADIAFLLLTFFLITTVIKNDKGLTLMLPPWNNNVTTESVHQRNVFTIQVNSENQFLIEGEPRSTLDGLTAEIKKFILNNNANPALSENPEKAIVSLKTDRGTSQQAFIDALDAIQAAYYEIYADRAGISTREFRELDLSTRKHQQIYDAARKGIPMNISMAEPTHAD
ncbi:MAG: biopolymer transporter ExbD [Bacteroidetes bacterium CHB5]|nr:biopolymer transporter ExbD [Bacteroidetes bacterium CHB5]